MDVRKNLVERLKQAEDEATKLRAALGALDGKSSPAPRAAARRRKVSAATRQKMSAAQKARRERRAEGARG